MSLKPLNQKAMALGRDRTAKIAAKRAEVANDEMMTDDAKSKYINGWTKSYNAQYDKAMAELRADAEYHAGQIRADGERLRPKIDPTSAADLTRTEQAWRLNVLPQLERGANLRSALRTADSDAVLGAERFAPAWLAANTPDPTRVSTLGLDPGRDHLSDVAAVATARFAELAGESNGPAIRAAGRVDAELSAFEQIAGMTDRGEVGLEAAVLSHYSSQEFAPVDGDEGGDTAA